MSDTPTQLDPEVPVGETSLDPEVPRVEAPDEVVVDDVPATDEATEATNPIAEALRNPEVLGRLRDRYSDDEILGLSPEVIAKYSRDDLVDGKIPEDIPAPGTAPPEMTAPDPTQDRYGHEPPPEKVAEANDRFEAELAKEADTTEADAAEEAAEAAVQANQEAAAAAEEAAGDPSPSDPEVPAPPTE